MSTTEVATTVAPAPAPTPARSLISKFANGLGVEPAKLLDTLKATAFRVKGDNGAEVAVSNEQMMALLIVADQYGLNPFTKEIYAFLDKHRGVVPVVGVDGWSRIINGHAQFDGIEFSMPDDGSSCTCSIWRKDRGRAISVTEYLAECKRNAGPWSSHPRRMLRHKAMIQCARMAFGFAGIHDQDEAERIVDAGAAAGESLALERTKPRRGDDVTVAGLTRAAAPADLVVDGATGEIVTEGDAPAEARGAQPEAEPVMTYAAAADLVRLAADRAGADEVVDLVRGQGMSAELLSDLARVRDRHHPAEKSAPAKGKA